MYSRHTQCSYTVVYIYIYIYIYIPIGHIYVPTAILTYVCLKTISKLFVTIYSTIYGSKIMYSQQSKFE